MPKIVGGHPPFIGTRDNITIYRMKGAYFVRTKSSLTGKRVKRDPAFARTMESAGRLKKAAVIASLVYNQMPENERVYKQYRELVGKAIRLLKEGLDTDYVLAALELAYLPASLSDNAFNGVSDNVSDVEEQFSAKGKPKSGQPFQKDFTLYKSFSRKLPTTRRRPEVADGFRQGSRAFGSLRDEIRR